MNFENRFNLLQCKITLSSGVGLGVRCIEGLGVKHNNKSRFFEPGPGPEESGIF